MSDRIRVLEIHSWGGLGSQLFTAAYALDMTVLNPRRNVVIIHHTNGLTRRELELDLFHKLGIPVLQIDDAVNLNSINSGILRPISKSFVTGFKSIFKSFLIYTHFVLYSGHKPKAVKIWTRQIRGHYFRRVLSQESVALIAQVLESLSNPRTMPHRGRTLLFHYRLGDLVHLKPTFISLKDMKPSLTQICVALNISAITVSSDSPELALKNLRDLFTEASSPDLNISNLILSPVELLIYGMRVEYFVGTNSKLSIWISILREYNFGFESQRRTFLPNSLKDDMYLISHSKVTYYELIKY